MSRKNLITGCFVLPERRRKRIVRNSKRFIGVDIGTSRIKTAEVQVNDAGMEIISLRECPTPAGEENDLISALKKLLPSRAREAVTAVGDGDVVSLIVQFPQLREKELKAAVRYEMERLFPSCENMMIRHLPLDVAQPCQGQELLLLAVPEDIIYRSCKIFNKAGLVLSAIDLSAFALWRLFGRDTRNSRVIIDFGAKYTKFVLVSNGVIRLLRTLPAGGDFLQSSSSVNAALNGLAGEIHCALTHYFNQEKLSIEKVILTGGASNTEGLSDYLQDFFRVPVEAGRPVIPELQHKDMDPAFAVAVGLALREAI